MTKPEAGMEQRARAEAILKKSIGKIVEGKTHSTMDCMIEYARAEVEAYRERVLARLIAMDANQLPWFEDVGRILEEEK